MTPKRQEYTEDTFYTMQNLYRLLKLFAMDFTIRRGGQITTKWSWIRVACVITVLSLLCGTSLYWKMAKFYLDLDISITVTDAVESIYDYIQYVVDLYFISTLGCKCKLEYYNYYKNIDVILGFKKYSAVKKEIDTLLMRFSAAWFISCSLDYAGWTMSFEYMRATVFSVVYIYIAGKLLTFLDLISNTLNLDHRLGAISEILEYYYDKEPNENGSCLSMVDPISNDKWIHTKSNKKYILEGRVYKITPVESDRKENVRWLSKCYLLLDEQCNFINRMFGFRVLLISISLLLDMVRFVNVAVRILIGSQKTTTNTNTLAAIATMLRFSLYAIILITVCYYCERSYRKRDRILSILDHMLINKEIFGEFRESLEALRSLVRSRPLDIHVAHFYRIDFALLCSTASAVVTYTIILTQIPE